MDGRGGRNEGMKGGKRDGGWGWRREYGMEAGWRERKKEGGMG
jgi:hypothetical protein